MSSRTDIETGDFAYIEGEFSHLHIHEAFAGAERLATLTTSAVHDGPHFMPTVRNMPLLLLRAVLEADDDAFVFRLDAASAPSRPGSPPVNGPAEPTASPAGPARSVEADPSVDRLFREGLVFWGADLAKRQPLKGDAV